MKRLTIEELLYVHRKWNKISTFPGKVQRFVLEGSMEPAVRLIFDNGRDVYYTMSDVAEAKKRLDATDNRQTT